MGGLWPSSGATVEILFQAIERNMSQIAKHRNNLFAQIQSTLKLLFFINQYIKMAQMFTFNQQLSCLSQCFSDL